MKTLLIDNYDSYTFNLYQLIAQINGESPLVVHNDQINWQDLEQLKFDNVVISPGPGHPGNERDFGICHQVLKELRQPILGVCLGHQGIGHVFGGSVTHAPEIKHGQISQIYHHQSELFEGIPNPFSAVRYHSLIVEKSNLPDCLDVTAWTEDGIIMGLRHQDYPIFGVQFHPESICSQYGHHILDNFRRITSKIIRKENNIHSSNSESKSLPYPQQSSPYREDELNFKIFVKKLNFLPNSEQVFIHLYDKRSYAFWLDSSQFEVGYSRFSFMGDDQGKNSFKVFYDCQKEEIKVIKNNKIISKKGRFLKYLQQKIDHLFCKHEDLPFDFNCGFVGYFAYELKLECGAQFAHPNSLPDAAFILATQMIVFDHQEKITYLLFLGKPEEAALAENWFCTLENRLKTLPSLPPLKSAPQQQPVLFRFSRSRQIYLQNIEQCLQKIYDGESYEICLTNRIYTKKRPNPLEFYRYLRHHNPSPYGGFLKFGDFTIVCSSPERFLKIDRERWVETKPIKGTSHRGQTPSEDLQIRERLGNSEKDRAENLMVLDLLRNDLGRVCEIGSIHVPKLMEVETYATVHQLVSTIRGHLRPEVTVTDCIRAAFPGGSMTGAPKLRTMEILDALEGEARGIYSGALGFLGLNGTADLNIVIRTAIITPTETSIGVGGGIIALSDPESEFEEILVKAKALIQALIHTR